MASNETLPPNDFDDVELSGNDDDDVVQHTPTSGNKRKRKEKETGDEGDGGNSSKKKKTSSRSYVWDHFSRKKGNPNKCNCHYCGKELACPSKSGTSTLKKHLELSCKAFKAWKSTNTDQTQTVIGRDGGDGSLTMYKVSELVIREASIEMLILGELPLSFIESVAWRHFCSKAKSYKPVSRRTTTREIVMLYVKKKVAMKKILGKSQQRMSLTTDIWVSNNTGESYMVITAHFVDVDWKLKKMIIGFKHVTDHNCGTICKVLLECLAEWDIRRIFCTTVDNATANNTALTKFKKTMKLIGDDALVLKGEYMHMRCAAPILNLVVKEGLTEVDASVTSIRNGIQFVRSSTNRLKSFDLRCDAGKISEVACL